MDALATALGAIKLIQQTRKLQAVKAKVVDLDEEVEYGQAHAAQLKADVEELDVTNTTLEAKNTELAGELAAAHAETYKARADGREASLAARAKLNQLREAFKATRAELREARAQQPVPVARAEAATQTEEAEEVLLADAATQLGSDEEEELAGDAGPQTKADASRKALIKKKCALSIEVLALKRELSDEKRACEDLRKEMSKKDAASGRKPRHPRKDA